MFGKKTSQVLKFLRKQPEQIGVARLLGKKLLLLGTELKDAKEICAEINRGGKWFKAHTKSDSEAILSVWHKELKPCLGRETDCPEDLAKEVVELFLKQIRQEGNIQLLSIKVILPEGADTEEISNYIVKNYSEYKACSKKQGQYPVVAIGYKKW